MPEKRPVRSMKTTPAEARELIGELLETVDPEAGTDELASPRQVYDWLTARGLLDHDVEITAEDAQVMMRMRDAIRDRHDAGGKPSRETIATLNWVMSKALLRVRFGRRGNVWTEPAVEGFDAAIGRLVIFLEAADAEGPGSIRRRRPSVDDRWLTR
ncbi:MAG: hypothetical protein GY719_02355 [bacterium]|nr:hypothetical protein [bacterium]